MCKCSSKPPLIWRSHVLSRTVSRIQDQDRKINVVADGLPSRSQTRSIFNGVALFVLQPCHFLLSLNCLVIFLHSSVTSTPYSALLRIKSPAQRFIDAIGKTAISLLFAKPLICGNRAVSLWWRSYGVASVGRELLSHSLTGRSMPLKFVLSILFGNRRIRTSCCRHKMR